MNAGASRRQVVRMGPLRRHPSDITESVDYAPALLVHREAPGLSLEDLVARAKVAGTVRSAVKHARCCRACTIAALCSTGQRLARRILPDWRRRRDSRGGRR